LALIEIPDILKETSLLELTTILPINKNIILDKTLGTYVYNFYNLDPTWGNNVLGNRVLLLEPSHFEVYPVSSKTIDFMINLAQKNIPNIKVYVGEFNDLCKEHKLDKIYYKEHPLNNHYKGIKQPREWMFEVQGYYSSFFSFWEKCKKQLSY